MELIKKIKAYGHLVMFSHTIFSLSFGVIAMLLVAKGTLEPHLFIWILIALLSARTGANAINRLIDRKIDGKNPRTANRQMPKGEMQSKEVVVFSSVCFIIMVVAAYQINLICFLLSPVALILMIGYSYTKRFTWLCHLILGFTCACAPVGAVLAVTGDFTWIALLMGVANMFWVAGFDIMYGSQDYEFDKKQGLHSIPVRFGVKKALLIAKLFHFIALASLGGIGLVSPSLNGVYFIGLGICGGLFIYQHAIIKPDHLVSVKLASYHVNQMISIVFLVFTTVSIYS